ncbi:MAG TPA: hypothetical protein VFC78_00980 [Tepidisphaeraceae bacterium]|nr:hypothetical protein [Tepidisphaeraceae bacterium]
MAEQTASAGHQLGQLVGDWMEQFVTLPLLQEVANRLRLYLDHGQRQRTCRDGKVIWNDEDGNTVAYDFVMELDGSDDCRGIPIAFFETFWRRGKRHSKDKARDDSGKLMPMRELHPTARFLGMIASGDFTNPAVQLVASRGIDLFLIPKAKIITAFGEHGVTIDYPDKFPEPDKAALVEKFRETMVDSLRTRIANRLRGLIGEANLLAYVDRVRSAMGALPQEFRIAARKTASPMAFETVDSVTKFLENPLFSFDGEASDDYVYQITYSDGATFERSVATIETLRTLHGQMERLVRHVEAIIK